MKRAAVLALAVAACKSPSQASSSSASASASAPASSNEPGAARPTHSGPRKDHPEGEAAVVVAGGAERAGDATVTPESVGLPRVDFGAAGPLRIKGYPEPLELGMRDYATFVGWTKDGGDVLACGNMSPLGQAKGAEPADTCFSRKRGSAKTERSRVDGMDQPHATPALLADLALLRSSVRSDPRRDEANGKLIPPALHGTWPYAKDLVIAVGDNGSALTIGGSVGSEAPVFPITMSVRTKTPDVTYGGVWNAVVASPDSTEIAFIGHFFCMEWCNDVVITRMTMGELASHIYNDTGFRHHQKKDYAASRDLFAKATWADPRAQLPPYNLACAYALLGDEANAEKALRLAIAVAGDKVKGRAQKDSDFAKVKTATWFVKLTS